jgi:hypothetical protein
LARGDALPCGDEIEREAGDAAARLEIAYDDRRLADLVQRGGREG